MRVVWVLMKSCGGTTQPVCVLSAESMAEDSLQWHRRFAIKGDDGTEYYLERSLPFEDYDEGAK